MNTSIHSDKYRGKLNKAQLNLILNHNNVHSKRVKACMFDYFVKGFTASDTAFFNNTTKSNVNRDIYKVEAIINFIKMYNTMSFENVPNN